MDTRSLHEAATITDPIERARVLTRLMTEDLGLTDAAARYRRHAIAQARDQGHTREQIAAALGVTPPRIAQISKGTGCESTRRTSHADALGARVQRALPTLPSVRKSHSLYLVEAERQGIKADRKMLHIGLEPGQRACRRHPSGPPRRGRGGRPQVDVRQRVPVRIAPSFFRADLFGDTRVVESAFVGVSQAAIEDLGAQTVINAVLALLAVAVLTLGSIAFFDVATPAEPPATCWQCCCSSRPCSPSGYW
jgi:GntR family transcriptional regulator